MCDVKRPTRCRQTDTAVIYNPDGGEHAMCDRCWDKHGGKSQDQILKLFAPRRRDAD